MRTLPVLAISSLLAAAVGVSEAPRPVSHSGFGAYEASIASSGDGFAVAWYDTRDGHPEIYARLLDATGIPSSPELRLTHGDRAAYEADIAAAGANLVVGWYEQGPGSQYRAMLGSWTRDGRALWTTRLSAEGRYGAYPVIRVDHNDIFCAWLEYAPGAIPEVRAQWFDLSGRPLGPGQRVAEAGRTTWNLNAALDEQGRAWVAFDAKIGTRAEELFLARVEKTTSRVVRLTSNDGKKSKYPDVAIAGGRIALTWFDERDGNQEVYLLVAPVGDLPKDIDRTALRVTHTSGESIGAYVAWSHGSVGLAWCDNTERQHEIYFESFDADGHAREPAARLTDNPTQSLIPAITASADGFALAWNEFTPGPGGGHDPRGRSEVVFARRP